MATVPAGKEQIYVYELYKRLLKRFPDENGLKHWVQQVVSRKGDPKEAARGVSYSLERRWRWVQHLYRELFDREGEYEEMKPLAEGRDTIDTIAYNMVQTAEFMSKLPDSLPDPVEERRHAPRFVCSFDELFDPEVVDLPEGYLKEESVGNSALQNFTTLDWEGQVLRSNVPVLAWFSADWCGPCRQVAPFVESAARKVGRAAVIGRVDVDDERELARRYRIGGIPQFISFQDGKEKDRPRAGGISEADMLRMVGQ
jgi:thioredoxin 1